MSHLRLADDIVLFRQTSRKLQSTLRQLCSDSSVAGFKINTKKSKVTSNKQAKEREFTVNDKILEAVSDYAYLWEVISADPNHEKKITRMRWAAFKMNYDIQNYRIFAILSTPRL